LRAVVLVLAFVVLAAIVYAMGPARIAAVILASGWTFLWMVLLYSAHLALRAWILWRSLPPGRLSLVDVLRIRFAAEAVEMLTFTGPFLAEPAKGWMFVRRGISPADAAATIAFEYLIYTLIAADLALAGLTALLRRHAFAAAVRDPIVVLVIGLGVFTAAVVFAAVTGIGLIEPAVRGMAPLMGRTRADSVLTRVRAVERPLLVLLHGSPSRVAEAIAVETMAHGLLVMEVWLLFSSLGIGSHLFVPFIVEGGAKFINAAFFFVPGQIGAAEGVNAAIVGALGLAPALGVALSLMRRARAAVVSLAGALAAPAFGKTNSQPA
jgi:hypothetical protein